MAYKVTLDAEVSPFSRRVAQVVELAMEGKTREAIALSLHIGVCTVNTHLQNAFNTAGVDNIQSLMTYLYAEGIAKATKTLLLCLVVSLTEQALCPAKAMARDLAPIPQMQGPLPPGEQSPEFIRNRGRSRSRVRAGSRFNRRGRRRANEFFMDSDALPLLAFDGERFFLPGDEGGRC